VPTRAARAAPPYARTRAGPRPPVRAPRPSGSVSCHAELPHTLASTAPPIICWSARCSLCRVHRPRPSRCTHGTNARRTLATKQGLPLPLVAFKTAHCSSSRVSGRPPGRHGCLHGDSRSRAATGLFERTTATVDLHPNLLNHLLPSRQCSFTGALASAAATAPLRRPHPSGGPSAPTDPKNRA
jgi:hypothetical protein